MSGLVIGLTGGIGVGKSTVSGLFGAHGAKVIDVDGLGRAVLEPDGGAYHGVVDTFGAGVVGDDGTIDRARLAAEVFGGGNRLGELEAISHPAINRLLVDLLAEGDDEVTILDLAVLAESRLGHTPDGRMYQRVVVVEADLAVRIPRLIERGMTEQEARDRMASQASDDDRRLLADLIVRNDSDLDDLRHIVDRLWPTVEAWAAQERRR